MLYPKQLLSELRKGAAPLPLALRLLRASLLDGLQSGERYERSLINCHTHGVDSVVLQDHDGSHNGMVRLYFAHHDYHGLDRIVGEDGHFVVGIHNHRYPIAKIPLNDRILNVRTTLVPKDMIDPPLMPGQLYEYSFDSAITGQGILGAPVKRQMERFWSDELKPGSVAIMKARDLHTVQVPKSDMLGTAWLVIEGPREKVAPLIYSPRDDLSIETEGLYEPMEPEHARWLIATILDLCDAPGVYG